MYRIIINEVILRTELTANDVLYWQTRLAKLFPACTIEIIRTAKDD